MQCPRCHANNNTADPFCESCGVQLARLCQRCGHGTRPGARFCGKCGEPTQLPTGAQDSATTEKHVDTPATVPSDGKSVEAISKVTEVTETLWRLAKVLLAIAALGIAAIEYFATRAELSEVECRASANLLLTALPTELDQLALKIKLAQGELVHLKTKSAEALSKQAEIDDLIQQKRKVTELREAAQSRVQTNACSTKTDSRSAKEIIHD